MADCDEAGYVLVSMAIIILDSLYAIGDMVSGLNQVAMGFGQAVVAASHIHQRLSQLTHRR